MTIWGTQFPMALPEQVDMTRSQIQIKIRDRDQFGILLLGSALLRFGSLFGRSRVEHCHLPVWVAVIYLNDLLLAVFLLAKNIK